MVTTENTSASGNTDVVSNAVKYGEWGGRPAASRAPPGATVINTNEIDASDHSPPVTTLELFFDLVFVFALTQLTAVITTTGGWQGFARSALALAVIYWLYNEYAVLTNTLSPTTTARRVPILLAMMSFLAMAAEIPQASGVGTWIFVAAYLVAVTIHAVQMSGPSLHAPAREIRLIVSTNYGVGALLVLAALLGYPWGWLLRGVAVAALAIAAVSRRHSTLPLRAEHFVERHTQLIMIALGETIIATGIGARRELAQPTVIGAFVLAMTLVSGLWWVSFSTGDEPRGLAEVEHTPADQRSWIVYRAYLPAHLLNIAGLVLVATGLHEDVNAPTHHLSGRLALTLPAGVAIFLLGRSVYRATLRIGRAWVQLVAGSAVLLITPVGVIGPAVLQLVCVTVVIVVLEIALSRDAARLEPGSAST